MKIDYEELLRKYIEHIAQCEGINYISRINHSWASDVLFTEDEIDALYNLSWKG